MTSLLDPARTRAEMLVGGGRPWRAWVLTRLVALALGGLAVALTKGNVFFDTSYYGTWAHGTLTGTRIPYQDFPWEYPPAALPVMLVPGIPLLLLPGRPPLYHYYGAYGALWVVFMLVIDAGVLRFLLRRAGDPPASADQRQPAITLWVYGLPLLGALSWSRYDMVPAAIAAVAVVRAGAGAGASAGRAAGIGGAMKIWPLLLAPVQRTRPAAIRATAAMAAVMVATAGVTFALTGETGFAQVLHYQSKRGLQIESLAALPYVWMRHLHVTGYRSQFAFGAYQVAGPGTLMVAHIVTALYAVGLLVLGYAHWRFMRRDAGRRLVALTAISFLLLTLVTNKVFSPQYVVWLLAVTAAASLLDPDTWRPYLPWVLALAGLTALMFPWLYGDITGTHWLGLLVMTARDGLLLGIAWAVSRRLLLELRTEALGEGVSDGQPVSSPESHFLSGEALRLRRG